MPETLFWDEAQIKPVAGDAIIGSGGRMALLRGRQPREAGDKVGGTGLKPPAGIGERSCLASQSPLKYADHSRLMAPCPAVHGAGLHPIPAHPACTSCRPLHTARLHTVPPALPLGWRPEPWKVGVPWAGAQIALFLVGRAVCLSWGSPWAKPAHPKPQPSLCLHL